MDSRGNSVPTKRTMRDYCRLLGTCARVAPWVPLIGSIMITVGLPVWAIYTRRALDASRTFSDALFGSRTIAMDQMISSVNWVTGLAVIIISAVVGLCLLLSLLRSYQETARLPTTKCGPPGKVSYGSYAALISAINFGLWAMSVVVALLIAAQLCWLLLAFVFETAFRQGVADAPAGVAPQAMYDAAKKMLNGLAADPAAVPAASPIAASVAAFAVAANQVPIIVCPVSCLNLGSFYYVFGASSSCACGAAAQYPLLAALTTDIWKYLVHALAALALMGLAGLWLIMNLSAQFAHARRDLADLSGPNRYCVDSARISADDAAAVYVTTNPTYGIPGSPAAKKAGAGGRRDISSRDTDTRKTGPATAAAMPAASEAPRDDFLPSSSGLTCGFGALATELQPLPTDAGDATTPTAAGDDARQQYNTTAQRYAAYRLRAAQATKSPGQDRKWQR